MKKLLTGLLLAALCLQLFGCAVQEHAPNETNGGVTEAMTEQKEEIAARNAAADFALALLQKCENGRDNCILSPYSILTALAMAENGADGETLRQFESVLGMPAGTLNAYLQGCFAAEGQEVVSANSVWLREEDGFALKEEFCEITQELFGAECFTAPFDAQTVEQVNAWVSDQTKQRIDRIVESLDDASMVLINALSFDAEWERKYTAADVRNGAFTAADGTVQEVKMLCGRENAYLDDGMATGFIKPYVGGKYSFVALLPNEGTDMQTYLSDLTGSKLLATIQGASDEQVTVKMPKLKTETTLKLSEQLEMLGLTNAFSGAADFSRMATENQHIDEVIHKTYLKIDEEGTEAAAATAVLMTKSARPERNGRSVTLDRPYVMAIVDHETDCLLFLGVVNGISE